MWSYYFIIIIIYLFILFLNILFISDLGFG